MLVTLKLYLADGRERQLSQECADDDPTPNEILRRMAKDGRIPLGDRESCSLDEIERVEVVPPPEPKSGPNWSEEDLRDEDLAAALSEQHQPAQPGRPRRR
jgi:hypothetical protein